MGDSTILYTGIVCFSLIILSLVLTMRAFSKMSETGNAGKRQTQGAYRT
jgi:hypothetical protein